jgi:hypothetical protein
VFIARSVHLTRIAESEVIPASELIDRKSVPLQGNESCGLNHEILKEYEGANGIVAVLLERAARLQSMLINPCPA